jgi:hypothetical protein
MQEVFSVNAGKKRSDFEFREKLLTSEQVDMHKVLAKGLLNNMMDAQKLPTYEDVVEAKKVLEGHAHRTKIMTSETINKELTELAQEHQWLSDEETGKKIEVFFKCENF